MIELNELNSRSQAIFRQVVETYLQSGDPVGSRTLSRAPGINLSAASVRNVMADLEEAGLLAAPHTSAGRIPTERGLRLFVDGMMELGDLSPEEMRGIEEMCSAEGRSPDDVLTEAIGALSGLSQCAGLVMAPKSESPVRHVEFVPLAPGRALVVVVSEGDAVENRVIELPQGLPPSALIEASNYLSRRFSGRTLSEAKTLIETELASRQAELDDLTAKVVSSGIATWAGGDAKPALIVRGRSNLLDDVKAQEDLERIRLLFDDLENKRDLISLLELVRDGDGVKIFIGSENTLFSLSGSSMVVSPYMNEANRIVGVVGVIGPTRLNYGRIIPMVNHTARLIGQLL